VDLGTLLRIARERKGWTQQEIARRLGITRADVSRYENNVKPIDLRLLQSWAKETGTGEIVGWHVAEMLGATERRWERALRLEIIAEQLRQVLHV
jgi:transcriptional regulator with XRE-family HTH domain